MPKLDTPTAAEVEDWATDLETPVARAIVNWKAGDSPLPATMAPPHVNNDLMSIYDHKWEGGKWWIRTDFGCRFGQNTMFEEDKSVWSAPMNVYKDAKVLCRPGEDNLLLQSARSRGAELPNELAWAIAHCHRQPAEQLFPCFAEMKSHKRPSKQKPTNKPKVMDQIIPAQCPSTVNHDDYVGGYRQEETNYYFGEGEKYESAECRECKKPFPTAANMSRKDWTRRGCDGEGKPFLCLPSSGKPVHICNHFSFNRSACGNVVCNGCFVSASSSKRSNSPNRRSSRRCNR